MIYINSKNEVFMKEKNILKIGDKAPNFCLPDQNEKVIWLENLRNKWVVLYFYPKDNTPGCTIEATDFTKYKKEFNNLNAVILGVSPDAIESHCNFEDKHSLKITLLSDTDNKVATDYNVWQLKKQYGKEYFGIVRSTFLIDPKGNISYIWSPVTVDGHVKDVLTKLENS
jgi:peroxiredoxin Q/BCP